jgi:transposase InsO family protein
VNVHGNAPWTPRRRRELIGLVDHGRLSVSDAAELGGVSERTVWRWLARWRNGDQLLEDRPSIAHTMPHATDPALVEQLLALRDQRWTSPALSYALKLPISTVTGILARHGRNRLPVETPEPPNRYQRRHAGEMVHVDIKKLGRFHRPGHRVHGDRTRRSDGAGWEYVHVAVDDASRVAWADVRETGETQTECVAFLRELVAWYAARGVTVTGVMSDNGPGYLSKAFAAACRQLGLKHYRTRPYRPRTNGKAERFIRMLCNDWAYAVTYSTSADRRRALPAWLHYYNHHRPHGSLDRATPGSRLHALTNASGIYN